MGSPSWDASKTRKPIFCSSQRGGRLQHQLSPTPPPLHRPHPSLPFGWVGKVFPFPKPTRKDQNTPGREPHFSLQLTSSLSVNTSEGLAGSRQRVLSGAWGGVSGLRKAGECSWQSIASPGSMGEEGDWTTTGGKVGEGEQQLQEVGLSEGAGIYQAPATGSPRMPGVCLVSGRSEYQPLMIHPGPSCQPSLS